MLHNCLPLSSEAFGGRKCLTWENNSSINLIFPSVRDIMLPSTSRQP